MDGPAASDHRDNDVIVTCEHNQAEWYMDNNARCLTEEGVDSMSNSTLIHPSVSADLRAYSEFYARYHGYASLCVCLGGIVTNMFNVTVLTRRHMRTPVNQILTGLAVSDIITMLSYVAFAAHFYCLHPSTAQTPEKNSYGWMTFFLFHINLTTATHTISIWLCVLLSIVRYLHIRSPTRASSVRQRRIMQTRYMVIGTYVLSPLVMIPNYLINELKQDNSTHAAPVGGGSNQTSTQVIYVLQSDTFDGNNTNTLRLTNFWMYAILGKLVPCTLMFTFGMLLVLQMRTKIRQRRGFLKVSASNTHKLHEHSRTTKMLVTVIVLFLITELPQGVLVILSACVPGFFMDVYIPLGDTMDILALVNNSINFALYCSMSSKFRQTFLQLYCRCPSNAKHGGTSNITGATTAGDLAAAATTNGVDDNAASGASHTSKSREGEGGGDGEGDEGKRREGSGEGSGESSRDRRRSLGGDSEVGKSGVTRTETRNGSEVGPALNGTRHFLNGNHGFGSPSKTCEMNATSTLGDDDNSDDEDDNYCDEDEGKVFNLKRLS